MGLWLANHFGGDRSRRACGHLQETRSPPPSWVARSGSQYAAASSSYGPMPFLRIRMTSELADTALCTAIARRRPTGTAIVHSDRGGKSGSLRYQRTLRAHGPSAAMESFFALLQKTVLNRRTWQTHD